MKSATYLYDLICSYGSPDDADPMPAFNAVWCEGITPQEAAVRLNADLGSATYGNFRENTGITMHGGYDERVVLVGRASDWTLVIGDDECTSNLSMAVLSAMDVRALSMGWNMSGAGAVKYAVGGSTVTRFAITDPAVRSGSNPHFLDAYAYGLRFHLGDDWKTGNDAAETAESITSALILIGRVTGREIDSTWLNATHTLYTIPED